jgi:Fe-S-cluster containining protein
MECLRCGKCCKQTFFALRDVPADKDKREIGKWAEYHSVKTSRYKIDGIDYLAVSLPGECKYLRQKKGKYYCYIYDERPNVCKDYYCQTAKDFSDALEKVRTQCIMPTVKG